MSLDKHDVVPVDTHIHSIAMTYYGQNDKNTSKQQLTTANYDDIASFFEKLWQPLSGWAQAVRFSFFQFYNSRYISFSQAAFSNELRLPPSSRTSLQSSARPLSLKRSISTHEILSRKIMKTLDHNGRCQPIKITIKRGQLRQKKLLLIEPIPIQISTRPKRNIKPVNRY